MDSQLDINIVGAAYYPKDAHIHPGSLINNLKSVIEARGVRFSYNTEVTDIETSDEQIQAITTADEQTYNGGNYINFAGAWSATLMKIVNKKLLIQAGKECSITLKNPAAQPKYCGILSEKKVTLTPMYNSLRFG
jgi:D-amino-acid dehydrogenase